MIKVLDQQTIDKIAAGEVIERPASIVKELVENSLDAGSTRITIEIKDGGTSFIRVTDNGCGIPADDVRKAYMSHATSKLDTAEDLNGIMTLGFRGEALSTIAAVTETEMLTKTRESMTGIRYVINGGKEEELSEAGTPDGTTIISRNLFYNTPARKKFLKTNMTEGSYIADLINHMALANPDTSFKLISNGKTMVSTAGDGKLKEVIYSLYGNDITKSVLPVDYTAGKIHVTGYIGKPFLSKGNRSFENYFVNKRYIKSPVINKAIEEAYKTYVMQHRFPFTVLFLELDPTSCDVNVHPAKAEFRYDDEKSLFSAVFHAVQDALKMDELIPDMSADYRQREKIYNPMGGASARAAEAAKKPEAASRPEASSSSEAGIPNIRPLFAEKNDAPKKPSSPSRSVDLSKMSDGLGSAGGFSILDKLLPDSYRKELSDLVMEKKAYKEKEAESSEALTVKDENGIESAENMSEASGETEVSDVTEVSTAPDVTEVSTAPDVSEGAESAGVSLIQKFSGGSDVSGTDIREKAGYGEASNILQKSDFKQERLFEDNFISEEAYKHHRIIGQLFKTYWLTEYNNELYIMDQHAAHEKVNYETFLKEFKSRKVESQQLFPPIIITLSNREKQAVLENLERFERAGYEVEDYGAGEVRISSVPINLIGLDAKDIFLEFAAYLAEGLNTLTEDIFVRKLGTMGCKAAIKGNQEISIEEASELMEKLLQLDNPYTCPHGRPTIIRFSKEDIDKKFKRIVE